VHPGGEFYGEDRLMRLLHGGAGSARELVDRVLRDVLDFQAGRARDDIALVALRVLARS
jgi:serine phosphatase RsbU (regulator of sigma subunit)